MNELERQYWNNRFDRLEKQNTELKVLIELAIPQEIMQAKTECEIKKRKEAYKMTATEKIKEEFNEIFQGLSIDGMSKLIKVARILLRKKKS